MNKYLNKYLRSSILLLMFCTSLTACASAGEEYLFDAAAKQQAGETPVKETSTQTPDPDYVGTGGQYRPSDGGEVQVLCGGGVR